MAWSKRSPFNIGVASESCYVSRAGLKLEHALREFDVDVTGLTCADFGCNVGGFTDCLLRHGAAKVYAIDTAYGTLDWKLRNDPRVVVMERTNALHLAEKAPDILLDVVVIDLGWTPQRLAIPAALDVLKRGGSIISLVKPHYELSEDEKRSLLRGGHLAEADAETILDRVLDQVRQLGVDIAHRTKSPVRGSKSSRKAGAAGNVEYLIHCQRAT